MVDTYKNKFNRKYGQPKDKSNSLADIARLTGRTKASLQAIYNKGIGAYKTNPASVRPNVKSKEAWAQARVYSAVMGGKAAKVDAKELKSGKKKKKKS
jgi:alkyl sulfatase BDS1-like metallo-beta-lactamase superfamily hydrolase